MKIHPPSGKMKIVTRCERVQPFNTGVDKKGELVWEGREMPRWQMELLRVAVDWFGPFFTRWVEVVKYESKQEDFDEAQSILNTLDAASKQRIAELKRRYPSKARRKASGD